MSASAPSREPSSPQAASPRDRSAAAYSRSLAIAWRRIREICIWEAHELADLLLGEVVLEAQGDDPSIARRQDGGQPGQSGALLGAVKAIVVACDGVAQGRGVVAAGHVERVGPPRVRGVEDVENVLVLQAEVIRQLGDSGVVTEHALEFARGAVDGQHAVLEIPGHAHRPGLVAVVALDLAGDGGDGERGERQFDGDVVAVDGDRVAFVGQALEEHTILAQPLVVARSSTALGLTLTGLGGHGVRSRYGARRHHAPRARTPRRGHGQGDVEAGDAQD